MRSYFNSSGNSGVVAYDIGDNYIEVAFKTGRPYRYSYRSAGRTNVEFMKVLARQGSGLNSFINRNVKFDYER